MLLYTVDWYEWQEDRRILDVCLILRVLAVCSVLTDLKSAGSAEHYIYDSDVTD